MAIITEPMALDASFNTTETTPRSIADVLAEMGEAIAHGMGRTANEVAYDNTTSGLSANDVQEAVDELAEEKVDKVTGKGLSTNDYTDEEQSKLAGIEAGAQVNPTIDSELSDSSTNAVQNKVVKGALNGKADNADVAGTKTVSGNPITLTDASETYAQSLVVELDPKQEGSGDPSPSNIRPITGYTECKVEDVGFNLFDKTKITPNSAITSTGELTQGSYNVSDPIDVIPNTSYYIKDVESLAHTRSIVWYDADGNLISVESTGGSATHVSLECTSPSNARYLRIGCNDDYLDVACVNIYKPTGTPKNGDYVPYHSTSATIQFGQTVYGGKVDFLTGVLTVTHGIVDLGTLELWNYDASTARFYSSNINTVAKGAKSNADPANMLCEVFPTVPYNSISSMDSVIALTTTSNLWAKDSRYTDAASFKTAMSGVMLAYELAEPQTIQLTPQELKLLKGTNNLTTNGTTINLGYQPDNVIGEVKVEIEKHLEMPYLRILDNDVDTEIKNYQLYYRLIASAYTLVNLAEMLQHRFLFVEIIQNPSGTANHTLLHSALIDPRTIDGFEYQMKAGTGDTVIIESNIAENKFDLSVRYTGTHTSGDPTDYYVTIRMVD